MPITTASGSMTGSVTRGSGQPRGESRPDSRLRKDSALWTVPGVRPPGPPVGRGLRGPSGRVGQAGGSEAGLADGDVPTLRQDGDQALQDVPGDVASGRR